VRSNTSYRPAYARDYFSGAQSNFLGGNTGGGVYDCPVSSLGTVSTHTCVGDPATSSSAPCDGDGVGHRLRLCHVTEWPDFPGFGFNVHTLRDKPGQYIGKVDADSPAAAAGRRNSVRLGFGYSLSRDVS